MKFQGHVRKRTSSVASFCLPIWKGSHNCAFLSSKGEEQRLKEALSLQAGEQYICHSRKSQYSLINEGAELKKSN